MRFLHVLRWPFIAPAVLLLLGALALPACRSDAAETRGRAYAPPPPLPHVAPDANLTGEALARVYCQACHLFPDPALLDRATWQEAVLPRMKRRLGLYENGTRPDSLFGTGAGARLIRKAGVFPDTAALTEEQWGRIAAYVLEAAPDTLPPQPARAPIRKGLDGFEVRKPPVRASVPMTSLVEIDEAAGRTYVGDFGQGLATLYVLDGAGQVLAERPVGSAPSSVLLQAGSLLLTDMRSQTPTDAPAGRLFRIPASPERFQGAPELLLKSLQRPVHVTAADLSGDGHEDLVVAEFGDKTGRLSWHERQGPGRFKEHVLKNAPGAVRSSVRDLDGDGRLDVVALMAQGDEGIFAFYNKGGGRFEEEPLVRFPPSYGSSSFELVDFDGDGHEDLLHTSGDNADYRPVMKPYHGVRVFLNDGENNFEQAYFYPLNGAYKATAADFDLDGDQDIAAISFFPDYEKSSEESFVYLKNQGGWIFEASTFEGSSALGRWLALDQGDVDQDGDVDLVLGSFVAAPPAYVPQEVQMRWRTEGAPVVILENKAR